ncbi:MAG: response regulator [Tannerellaceae bacterium]|nr:response regulator [Tannerellaceae bacterium]
MKESSHLRYEVNEVDIHSGIFCLVKDRYQDVIWAGTDGQGVFMCYMNSFTLRSHPMVLLSSQISNPVRALLVDRQQTLWIGTKGDGIVRVREYAFDAGITGKEVDYLHTENTVLADNAIYTFSESTRPVLWIGTEEGINYYSFQDQKIKTLKGNSPDGPIRYVHSISETSDTVVWVATVGEGIVKIKLSESAGEPVIESTKRFVIDGGLKSSNYFFNSFVENDSIIWFANRGLGAFRFNTHTEHYTVYNFKEHTNNQHVNDVFSITKNEDGYWFGTSFGLVRLHEGELTVFNESYGFPNHTVHAILPEGRHELWLSTNQGVIRFNTRQLTFQTFREYHEMAVTEFSDGAYYQDASTGNLLFGGINGFLSILTNEYEQPAYMPAIRFTNLSIFGKEHNINDFFNKKKKKPTLELSYGQNFFTVSFTALDYIHGNDYTWLYKLDELSDNWIENGKSGTATFTNISPGTYHLSVKYRNPILGKESDIYSLAVTILPPWYRTVYAYAVYFLLFLLGLVIIFRLTRQWYEMKKTNMIEKLTRQQKEEIYESKLRFFTNITHELCTPLTLIYGPCDRIISYQRSDRYVRKYASLIKQNVEKLNALIQELIEFRRLETGHMVPKIRPVSLSGVVSGVAESFSELAESRGITYLLRIPGDIQWNSDPGCLSKIITNLISNAFKYTSEHGQVTVCLAEHPKGVSLEITNTGKEIPADRMKEIFDRYKILDAFELESGKGLSARNGLGLAICHSLVHLLHGEIEVNSGNGVTTFRVVLPPLQKEEEQEPVPVIAEDTIPLVQEEAVAVDFRELPVDPDKFTLMIVEDDPAMLWFITEIFMDTYNVIPLQDARQVEESLKTRLPDLVISDVMMPDLDGISLTRFLKGNKFFSHIPVILLSARIDAEEQVRGIEAGADVYITKPFNVTYLEKLVGRFLHRKDQLKEYYGSAISAYQLNTNGHLVHKEDKAVFDKILRIIDENINNPELNVDLVSSSLGVSTRQLYRRIKSVTDQTPSDLIKEQRLKMAEQLLITTTYSIDEIIYKTGYTNRGNFFRIFSARYGMTPKQYRQQKKEELEKDSARPPKRG